MQTVSGKLRQATFALPHLIGAAVAYATQPKESRRFTGDVVKVKRHFGMQPSDGSLPSNQSPVVKYINVCMYVVLMQKQHQVLDCKVEMNEGFTYVFHIL